jgi:hypothetical protein
MPPLAPQLRKQLEKAIVQAREQAELGAKKALESLAVHHHEPHGSMTPEQRKLRNRLRAHGRQFGDRRDDQGGQRIDRLLREVAYEHWHRMLFARFLAENELLIEPSNRVSVSLGDVEDLARERGLDPWSMAASFAQRMLPQIFRTDDPVLQVALPPETTQALQQLVLELDAQVFRADDSLGWTYQFWQSAEKDAVNARVKSGEKISGETLPAVTQLFTEHYMVQFLLHNTLGAWHAGKVLAARPELATTAQSEGELRAAVALPGYTFDYLRFVREGENAPWRPAAGVFAAWPRTAKELKVLDPCCGSGHFLVAGFELLATLRQHEEALGVAEAVAAVLRENLFGLELDARCVQIAAFALAMAAWKRAGGVVEPPPLQVACCGVGPSGTKEQWLRLAEQAAAKGGLPVRRDLFGKEESLLSMPIRNALEDLYLLFQKAPELGSLIDPKGTAAGLYQADFKTVQPLLERVLQSESAGEDAQEQAVAAQGMARAAAILGQTFTLVVTNVPYLGRGAQGDVLKAFAEQHYPDAKADLATVFVQRAFGWLGKVGTMAVVTPQNWLFLTSYRKLREKLLRERKWDFVGRLGPRAFETIGGHVVNVALVTASASKPAEEHAMGGVDVSAAVTPAAKAALLRGEAPSPIAASNGESEGEKLEATPEVAEGDADAPSSGPADGRVKLVLQADQLENPDAVVTLSAGRSERLLDQHAIGLAGVLNGDSERFERRCWEQPVGPSSRWAMHQSTPEKTLHFGGCEKALLWDDGEGELRSFARVLRERLHDADRRGNQAWGRSGVAVKQMGHLPVTRYLGTKFDSNVAVVLPVADDLTPAVWCYCSSEQYVRDLRRINQNLNVTNATLVKVPFDIDHWQRVAAEQYPHGLPEPQTNDPTQWLFHGHPAGMTAAGGADSSPLAVADPSLPQHPSLLCRTPNLADVLQVATARLLGYRWPAELDPAMRLDAVQHAWTTRSAELLPCADQDGIVCLNPIRGEASASDRLRSLLQAAFGPQWRPDTERRLLAAAGDGGQPAASLHDWLRDDFFAAHCKLFHDRPFVWHVWDGLKDGFHALVNYHKLAGPNGEGRRTLELLTFTYLNDWIERQRADIKSGLEGADGRLAAAIRLQDELKKVLLGEPPYDLFIRWKPLHQQPLGWDPDINDGVRLNIRPFILAADMKARGAGLLRSKVGVKWTKDRGKEPEPLRPCAQFPWFWSYDPENPQHRTDYVAAKNAEFDGVRWNDLHYSRSVKQAAREASAKVSP